MAEKLNELLADKATLLVRENRDLSEGTGRETSSVRRAIADGLGLEDDEPVVLTFEVSGEVTVAEAARLLQARSSHPEGLAAAIYAEVREALEGG